MRRRLYCLLFGHVWHELRREATLHGTAVLLRCDACPALRTVETRR